MPQLSRLAAPGTRRALKADVVALAATGLLVLVALWRLGLALLLQTVPTPGPLAAFLPGDVPVRLVLITERADSTRVHRLAAAHREGSAPPLHVVTLDGAEHERALRGLIRSYGYSRPPLLLTLDRQGHVVKVSPL